MGQQSHQKEMYSNGDTSTKPIGFINFCMREYVAEVRRKDWKKCYPFKLFGDSAESDRQAKIVYSSLLEDNDAFVNNPEYAESPNSNTINEGPSESACRMMEQSQNQNEKSIAEEAVAAETDKPQDTSIDDAANTINNGPVESASIEVNDSQCQNENSIAEVALAAERDEAPKFRLLSDIYKELADPCDAASESEDSDGITLDTFMKKNKGVGVTSKSIGALGNKRKSPRFVERRLDQAKRSKPVSDQDSDGNDSKLGSKRHLRKTKVDDLDLQTKNKRKRSTVELVHDDPSSLGGKDNTFGTQKDSPLPADMVKNNTQLVQTTAGRNIQVEPSEAHNLIDATTGTETVFGCMQKRIRESSPPCDEQIMAAWQLLRLSKEGVQTKTSSMTPIDGVVPPASGSSMPCQPCVGVNMNNAAGLPQAEPTESETSVCFINRNPSEFSIRNARRFMRRGLVLKTVQ